METYIGMTKNITKTLLDESAAGGTTMSKYGREEHWEGPSMGPEKQYPQYPGYKTIESLVRQSWVERMTESWAEDPAHNYKDKMTLSSAVSSVPDFHCFKLHYFGGERG